MATFAESLRALCVEEIKRSYGYPNASAAMVTELTAATASAIALLMTGHDTDSQLLARQVADDLLGIVAEKAAVVRSGAEWAR